MIRVLVPRQQAGYNKLRFNFECEEDVTTTTETEEVSANVIGVQGVP